VLVAGLGGLSLWKAANLTPIASVPTFNNAYGSCSDGLNFWVTFNGANLLARF
jgi:hypothetical protein